MSIITEFKLGKGTGNEKHLEVTVKLPENATEETIQEALIRAEYLVDNWLTQPEVARIPHIDVAELDGLPWKNREKEPAKPGSWGWLCGPESRGGTTEGAQTLADALLHTQDHKFVLGDMEYSLSADKVFINRKPLKQVK